MDNISDLQNSTYDDIIINSQDVFPFTTNNKDQNSYIDNQTNSNDNSTNNYIKNKNICITSNQTFLIDSEQSNQIFSDDDQVEVSHHEISFENENFSNYIIKNIQSLNVNKIDLSHFDKVCDITRKDNAYIYLIRDKSTKLKYVAKEIYYSYYDDFIRELTILSKVNHPLIVKVLGYSLYNFKQEPSLIIIMEFVKNGSLERILKEERNKNSIKIWTETVKLIIVYGIASAILYLHSNGILHLDIKPDNIMINKYILPIIIDFGASLIENCPNIKKSIIDGTVPFMAPEVCNNGKRTIKTDVYSFGVLLYVILTTKAPFKFCNPQQYQYQIIIKGTRPDLDDENIPDFYKDLIERCWDENPENRPTFQMIIDELKNCKDFNKIGIDEDLFGSFIEFVESYENGTDLTFKLDERFNEYNLDKLYKSQKKNNQCLSSSNSSILNTDDEDEENDDSE